MYEAIEWLLLIEKKKKTVQIRKRRRIYSLLYVTESTLWLIELTCIYVRWAIFIPQATEGDFFVYYYTQHIRRSKVTIIGVLFLLAAPSA